MTLLGPLRELAKESSLSSEAASVAELLTELDQHFGAKFGKRARMARILVNGSPIQFGRGKRTRIGDGDEVALIFPVGGG